MSANNVLQSIGSPLPRKWHVRLNGIDAYLVDERWECDDPDTLFALQKDDYKAFDEWYGLGDAGPRNQYERESYTVAHAVEHLGAEDLTPPPEYVYDNVLF
jgi:hypothetical protein